MYETRFRSVVTDTADISRLKVAHDDPLLLNPS